MRFLYREGKSKDVGALYPSILCAFIAIIYIRAAEDVALLSARVSTALKPPKIMSTVEATSADIFGNASNPREPPETKTSSDRPPDLTTKEPTDSHIRDIANESSPSSRRSSRKRKQAQASDPLMVTTEAKAKKRKPKAKDIEAEFATLWICSECKEAECMMKQDAQQLLICEGSCRRLFHYPCAGLTQLPAEDEAYVCKDCKERKHACSICGDYGEDGLDIFLCSKATCGLFFHEACLSMQNVPVRIVEDESLKASSASNNGETEEQIPSGKRVFVCPAHACWTCNQVDLRNQESEAAKVAAKEETKKSNKRKKKKPTSAVFSSKPEHQMIRCLECPISYHFSCIPPSARFHELAMLCHEHSANCKLPYLDHENSLQHQIEKKADQFFAVSQARQRKNLLKGKNLFFPGMSGSSLTAREAKLVDTLRSRGEVSDLPFCLPCDIRDEVHSKPPSYRHVHSLQYDANKRPQRIPRSGDKCNCVNVCGDDCINRMLYVECYGDGNRNSNCRVGSKCGNRQVTQRKSAKCKPKREHGKGWGLVTLEKIPKGNLVQEYVGEVIDETTKEERLKQWAQEHPNDPNFYVMSLCKGWFIDAREVANLSRFINHSCEPNCVLLPINVGGYIRNAIIALRDIQPNEFLSYDYHFDTRQGDKFVCRCGSAKCRGTMKGGAKAAESNATTKTASQIWEEAKASYERDKKFCVEYLEDEARRRFQFGESVPGSDNPEELVANGPQPRNRRNAIQNRVFLWRNAIQGSNFAARIARVEAKQKTKGK